MTDTITLTPQQLENVVAAVVRGLGAQPVSTDDVEKPRFEAVLDEAESAPADTGEPRPRGRHAGSSVGTTNVPYLPDHVTDTVAVDRWILDVPEIFTTDRITYLTGGGQIPKGEEFLVWSYVPKYGAKTRQHDGELRSRYDWDAEAWKARYISDRHIARVASLRVNEQTAAIAKWPHMKRVFKACFDSGFYLADKYTPERGNSIWTLVNFATGVVLDVVWAQPGSVFVKRMGNLTPGSDAWKEYLSEARSYNPNADIKTE